MVYWMYKRYWSVHVLNYRKHINKTTCLSKRKKKINQTTLNELHQIAQNIDRKDVLVWGATRGQSNLSPTEKFSPFQSPRHNHFLYNQIPKARALDLPNWGRPVYFMGQSLVSQLKEEVKFLSCSYWSLMELLIMLHNTSLCARFAIKIFFLFSFKNYLL